jgi:hypothetical protein
MLIKLQEKVKKLYHLINHIYLPESKFNAVNLVKAHLIENINNKKNKLKDLRIPV